MPDTERPVITRSTAPPPAYLKPEWERLELSVVIPCLNEEKTLGATIEKAQRAIIALGLLGEVVVSDNGSTDGSIALAESLGARVVHAPKRGYGVAVRYGMAQAHGRWLIMGDADDTYDFGEIARFIEPLRAGADLVMGTRLPPGTIMPGANPWLNRYVGTPVLTFVLNRLFGVSVSDCNCGMRAIRRNTFLELDMRSEGMEFASEMIIKAALHGVDIKEVPVTLHVDRRGRPSHLRRWHDGWKHLEFMLLHAPDQLLFWPGSILIALGALLVVPVSMGPVTVFGKLWDFHEIFYGGTVLLVGLQGVLGALTARALVQGVVIRPSRVASAVLRKFTLGRGLALAAALVAAGIIIELTIVRTWVSHGMEGLNEPRRGSLGMLFVGCGAEIGIFSFLQAVLRKQMG